MLHDIDIIITNYNYGQFLGRCIRSCINQSFPDDNYKIIVVDDCSDDNSNYVINHHKDHIKAFYNISNVGLASSLNRALESAMGQYIVRVDADDYISNEMLKFEWMFLYYNISYDGVSCDYYMVDDDGEICKRMDGQKNPIGCGIMFRYDALVDVGFYTEGLKISEDVDLRKKLKLKEKKIGHINIPLYKYRIHDDSLTDNRKQRRK